MRKPPPDPSDRLFKIADFVMENAPSGSAVRRAFGTFQAQREKDEGPSWGARQLAWANWCALSPEEQARILNGWKFEESQPSSRELAACEGEVVRTLEINCRRDGRLSLMPHFTLTDDTSPLHIFIAEGTDRPTVLAALRSALAAMERHFSEVIAMESYSTIEVEGAPLLADTLEIDQALNRVEEAMGKVRAALERKPPNCAEITRVTDGQGNVLTGPMLADRIAEATKKKPQTGSKSTSKLDGAKGKSKATAAH